MLERLPPGAFAVVMATGILSLGAQDEGRHWLSLVLFALAALAYAVVLALTLARAVRHTSRVREDLRSGHRAVDFLTFVAGTAVLGSRFVAAGWTSVALALWLVAAASWLMLKIAVLPRLQPRLGGNWLLVIVAAQALAVLAADLPSHALFLCALALFAFGCGVYLVLVVPLGRRLVRLHDDVAPDYWIVMGALAITTLAGTALGLHAPAVVAWVLALAWLPPLVAWEWRARRFGYEAARWATVFPLGMLCVSTRRLGGALGVAPLDWLSHVFFWIAFAVWLLVCGGLARLVTRPSRAAGGDAARPGRGASAPSRR